MMLLLWDEGDTCAGYWVTGQEGWQCNEQEHEQEQDQEHKPEHKHNNEQYKCFADALHGFS